MKKRFMQCSKIALWIPMKPLKGSSFRVFFLLISLLNFLYVGLSWFVLIVFFVLIHVFSFASTHLNFLIFFSLGLIWWGFHCRLLTVVRAKLKLHSFIFLELNIHLFLPCWSIEISFENFGVLLKLGFLFLIFHTQ